MYKRQSTFLRGDSTFQTVNTDLVSDTSPQLGGNLDVNTKNIVFGDSSGATDDRLTFGAGTDLSIYHDGSHSYIKDSGTGDLTLIASKTVIGSSNNAEVCASFIENGAVELYYDNSIKLYTDDDGVTIGGPGYEQLKIDGQVGDCILASSGAEIQFTRDSQNNITCTGASSSLLINGNSKVMAKFISNGAAELYHDNGKRLETTVNGITMTGDQLVIGTNGQIPTLKAGGTNTDIRIAAVGSGGYVELNTNNNGRWRVDGSAGHFYPVFDNSHDIGTSSKRVRNIYTADLHCSNRGSKNDVDGTWGDYTIQEGESDLFLINNRSGKKYKFNLTEVS